NQHNTIHGGSGHDILIGDRGNDHLDGGTGHDQLYGGVGSDVIEGGGGRDMLVGGPGDDRYSLRTPLLTLEQAFRSLGGDPSTLKPVELDGELISWEKFRLWADPRRWKGEVQWQQYERLGFWPDPLLYRRAATDESVGWLRLSAGGTVIRDEGGLSGAEDELTLELPYLLSLDGVQAGSIGFVRGNGTGRSGNNDLLIDLDADGVVNPARDLTIENDFAGDGSGSGAISAIRQYGLIGDYYFGKDFEQRFLRRVDAAIDFDWGYLLPTGSDLDSAPGLPRGWDGALSARWRGQLQPATEGYYRFRVTADGGRADAWELFVDGEKIDNPAEQLRLRAGAAVDLELRWRDPAVGGSSGDHAVKLEWSLNGSSFETIGTEALRTGVTVTSLDVLGSTDLLVPQLNRALFTGETKGWESGVAWGDIDNDTDLDLQHWGFDSLGNGEAQILINDIDAAGQRSFNASFDLPIFDQIHQAEWGDWNRDGWIDLLVSGQRTGDDFVRRNVVEVLQNDGGIGFRVVTPSHWAADLSAWESDPTAILRAAWGDLDADGLADVAVSSSAGDTLLVLPGNGGSSYEQALLAGMNGTRLQFGYYDTEQGEHNSGDRDPLRPTARLASGMDIAVNRSWQGIDYEQVANQQTVSFWRSDSTLFDVPQDLLVLDSLLASLEVQLPGHETLAGGLQANERLDLRTLVELELGRSDFQAAYALFRLPRSVFAGSFNAASGIVETAPSSQTAAIALARQGAGSALDAFLLQHQDQWQLLGNGAFNQTPLTFRHDPDYVYFLGIDDSQISVRDNPHSDILKANFNLDELTGPNPTGPIIHDRPLFDSKDPSSTLLTAGRNFLAQLFQLSTAVGPQGQPISGILAGDSLLIWLKSFDTTLSSPVDLIGIEKSTSSDTSITASLIRNRTSDFDFSFGFGFDSLDLRSKFNIKLNPSLDLNFSQVSTSAFINNITPISGAISDITPSNGGAELADTSPAIALPPSINLPIASLFPSFALQLGLKDATVQQRLIQLLASGLQASVVDETFSRSLPSPSQSLPISETSRTSTKTLLSNLWDVERGSTATIAIPSYQELSSQANLTTSKAQSSKDISLSSRSLSLGQNRVAAFAEFPRLERAPEAGEKEPSDVYTAYWLPAADEKGSLSFSWLTQLEDKFNDLSTRSTTVDPFASMVTIELPVAINIHSINLEVDYISNWLEKTPAYATRELAAHPFRVNQYTKQTTSGTDNYQLVDSRVVWLEGNQIYTDAYVGKVDLISFTPYYSSGSLYSIPLVNGVPGVGLQLSIDDIYSERTSSQTENFTLNYETYTLADSDLQISAYRGKQLTGDKLGEAIVECGTGALEISLTTLPVLPLPVLRLGKESGEAFSLNAISFADNSKGNFNATITYYDGSSSALSLVFDGTPLSAAAQGKGLLKHLSERPVRTIEVRAAGSSLSLVSNSLLSHTLGILNLQVGSGLGSAPFNLNRDLSNATLENLGPIPSAARLHLDTAVLQGLSADRVALEELVLMLAASRSLSLFGGASDVLDLSGRSFADLIAIGRSGLLDGKPVNAPEFNIADLASLLSRDLILRPTTIGLIDDIHTLDEAVQVLLRPVESPLEVLRNTAALAPETREAHLELAEGSLLPDATLAAFGDVDLGGPITDLYLGGIRAGMIAYDPVFALPGTPEASRSVLPSLAMVTLHDSIHPLLEEGLQRTTLAAPASGGRHPLLPGPIGGGSGLDRGNTVVHRDFSLAELIGTPIPGRTDQIQALSAFPAQFAGASSTTPLALRLQIQSRVGTLLERLQD
ncbi:MAG: hypothetical protein ACKOCM_12885, partial [Cyanobacteriota bacterium]